MVFSSGIRLLSPLLAPVMGLITGIALCFNFLSGYISQGYIALFWGILLTALVYTHKTSFFVPTTLCILMIIFGWGRTISVMHRFTQFYQQYAHQTLALKGSVTHTSVAVKSRMRYSITIQIEAIDNNPVKDIFMQLYTPHQLAVDIGDIIELGNVYVPSISNTRFNHYLIKEGITTTIFQEQVECRLLHRPVSNIYRWLFHTRKNLLSSLKQKLSHPTFVLFASLFLGEKESIKKSLESIQRQFKHWGILHILARSGLHLVMVLSAYEYLFRLLPVSLGYKYGILLIFTLIYYLLSWPSISFIRAFIIFLLYKLFAFFYIPTHFIHILLLTCIIILLANPMQLFFIDFQLSFGLTFALGWLNQYKATQTSH